MSKFCQKCGKELLDAAVMCPGCGSTIDSAPAPKVVSYDAPVKSAGITLAISIALLVLGATVGLTVDSLIGAVVCLAAELVALIPNTRLQSMLKKNVTAPDSLQKKTEMKNITKELRSKYPAFAASFILSFVALAGVIVFAAFI